MKEKYFKAFFFTIVIIILIVSIYHVIKNNKTHDSNTLKEKSYKNISYEINFGIVKYDTLNPILSKNQDVQYISKLIYDPIINISEDFNLVQGIAEEWNKLDNKTYLIKLKEDVLWSNGEKLTSKDVLYTVNYIKTNESIYNDNVKNIEDVEIINDYLLKIHLKVPEDYFEYMLTFPIICEEENIGTGRYIIDSIDDNLVVLKSKKNKQIIKFKVFENSNKLYNAFLEEKIDMFLTTNENYSKYIGQVGHEKNIICGRRFDYLKINQKSNLLKEKEVVEAISKLINKNEIINKVYNGIYNRAEFFLQYGSYLYDDNIKYEYNINKAQKILEDANWVYDR